MREPICWKKITQHIWIMKLKHTSRWSYDVQLCQLLFHQYVYSLSSAFRCHFHHNDPSNQSVSVSCSAWGARWGCSSAGSLAGWFCITFSEFMCGLFLARPCCWKLVVTNCGKNFVFLVIHGFNDLQLILLLLEFLWLLLLVSPLSWGPRARLTYLIISTSVISWILSSCFLWRVHFSSMSVTVLKAYLPDGKFIFSNDLVKIQSHVGCKYSVRWMGCLFVNACNSA